MPYNRKDNIVRDGIRNGGDGYGKSRKPRKCKALIRMVDETK